MLRLSTLFLKPRRPLTAVALAGGMLLAGLTWADSPAPAKEGEGGDAVFVLVKDSGFGGLMISKGTDFSRFENVTFLPTDLEQMEISSKASGDAARSWRRASADEFSTIADTISEMADTVFRNKENLGLAGEPSSGTLAIQVRLTEFFPMMVVAEDAYGGTIGSQKGRGNLGIVQVTAVLVDVESREMIGVIQDVVTLRANNVKRNTRSNQTRIWKTSFEDWLEKLHGALVRLKGSSPAD